MSRARKRTRPRPRVAFAGRAPASGPPPFAGHTPGLRRRAATAAALGAGHLALVLLARQPAPHTGGDNAVYLSLARALRTGHYREIWDPAAGVHTQFPPGFPALLALLPASDGVPWQAAKLLVAVFGAAAVGLTYLWLLRRGSPRMALGVGLLTALSPGVVALGRWELSDVPFWAVLTAALLAWERLPRGRRGRLAVAAGLSAAAYLIRPAALPLVLAAAAWLLLRRRWTQLALYAGIVLPPVTAWWVWNRRHGGYGGLISRATAYGPGDEAVSAVGLVLRAGENATGYAGRFLPALLSGGTSAAAVALSLALLGLAGWGWAMRLRRPGVAEAMLPLYLGMLLVWQPEWSGERLLLPVLPLLLHLGAAGGAEVLRALRVGRYAPAAGVTAAALVLLGGAPSLARTVGEGRECSLRARAGEPYPCVPPEWSDFFAMADAAHAELPASAVVISRKPALFFAVSGRRSVRYPATREPAAFLAEAARAGAGYVVLDYLDQLGTTFLTPVLMRRPGAFCVVRAPGPAGGALLGILPGAASVPDVRDDPGAAEMGVSFPPCPAAGR